MRRRNCEIFVIIITIISGNVDTQSIVTEVTARDIKILGRVRDGRDSGATFMIFKMGFVEEKRAGRTGYRLRSVI